MIDKQHSDVVLVETIVFELAHGLLDLEVISVVGVETY